MNTLPNPSALIGACSALWLVLVSSATAYTPPIDRVGPIEARIEGPGVVSKAGTWLDVRVLVANSDKRPITGTLRLGVIDQWRAEPPVAMPFSVKPKDSVVHRFKVFVGEPTYSAHYPIHAFVRFEHDGQPMVAHPVLIVETQLPPPQRDVVSVPWKATTSPINGKLALWRLSVHRSIVEVFGQQAKVMPVGWQGSGTESRGSLSLRRQTLGGEMRDVVAIHPPWHDGHVGTMAIEYPLTLPDCRPITLRFANAVTPTGEGDGVTFRVRVAAADAPLGHSGEVVFERHIDARRFELAEVDLGRFAGKTVRLQLESHPGPNNNTGWDQSYWAEPTLVVGNPPQPPPFPPKDDAGSQRLGVLRRDGTQYEVRVWPGRRGLLDAVVGFRSENTQLHFRGFEISVLGGRIDDDRSPILLQDTREEPSSEGYRVRHRFEGPTATFDLVGRLYVEGGALRAAFHLENVPPPKPWSAVFLEDVAAGSFGRKVRQVYAGHGNVIRDPGTMRLNFDGHRLATSFVGFDFDGGISLVQGVDVPPSCLQVEPTDRHYSLHTSHATTMTFIPAADVWQGVRVWRDVNGLKPAGGVRRLAGRFVFDLWGGRYEESRQELLRAFRYGLTDSMVVWHNWQRHGYDYRLPDIYPANPHWGTHEEFCRLAAECRSAGVLFAPHDNYIDFYPDAEGFSYEKRIAFHRDGTPVKAWLNEGRNARSYRYRADAVEPYLRRNLKLIHEGVAPDAFFIDVWSSVRPYDYWTADGRFFDGVATRDSWGLHFASIRDLLGNNAPQVSESGHDQLIGWLDGAQTNHLRVGEPIGDGRNSWCVWNVPCSDAERTPWFDAAHHDRFILHGAGYSGRYQGGLDARLHGIYSDDYIATEVLTGHPAMVGRPFGRDVVRKYWLTHDLMRALALRQIETVHFAADDLHRQHIQWSGGGDVWVNRGSIDWKVAGRTLPPYGFYARVLTDRGLVAASITRRDGIIVEEAHGPDHVYVNGRAVIDARLPVSATVESVQLHDARRFTIPLRWQLDVPIPEGYRPFLHLVDDKGEIVFQASQDPAPLADGRTGRIETTAVGYLPETLPEETTWGLCLGFYRPTDGRRLPLTGPDDGTGRIRLGTIRLGVKGGRPDGMAWTPHQPKPDAWLARQNPQAKPIDFGGITTATGVRLSRDGNRLLLTPLPNTGKDEFTVRLTPAVLRWQLPQPRHVEMLGEDGEVIRRVPVQRQGDTILIEVEPATFAYRLTP